ncbi:MAG: hypothetical protein AAFV33_19765, partial [Chloroflexota bacterium]
GIPVSEWGMRLAEYKKSASRFIVSGSVVYFACKKTFEEWYCMLCWDIVDLYEAIHTFRLDHAEP